MVCATMTRIAFAASLALTLAVTSLAATPEQACQSTKNKLAGAYDQCRQKVEAKYATTGDAAGRALALQKCLDKYNLKWSAAEAKAVAAGSACPSTGDQTAIQAMTDSHTTNIAAGLAGGALVLNRFQATGQTTCWNSSGSVISCTGTGHDGDIQAGGALAYTDNGDGTITDNNTGLMWEKLSQDGSIHDENNFYTWDNAFAVKVATLNAGGFAGHSDWRLPNVRELQSIINYGVANPAVSPAFNTSCAPSCTVTTCSCTVSGSYWSSSTAAGFPRYAWFVMFAGGDMSGDFKTQSYWVRAVRGGS
jgi:hypothetical protein